MQGKKRSSNIELLRLIAMFMIVLSHATQYMSGGTYWNQIVNEPLSWNLLFGSILGGGGQTAVIIFVAITSFYQCDKKKKVSLSRLTEIAIDTVILNLIIRIADLIAAKNVSIGNVIIAIVKAVFSPISGEYWFVTAFLVFGLLVPILRTGVEAFSRDQLQKCCVVLTIVLMCSDFFYLRFAGSVIDFVYVFVLISYLKRYEYERMNQNCKKYFVLSGLSIVTLCLLLKVAAEATQKDFFAKGITHVFVNWNPILVVFSVSIFWMFYIMDLKNNKAVNKAAGCVFGVYILHENQVLSGKNSLLWCQIFRLNKHFYSFGFPIILIADALVVFGVTLTLALLYKMMKGILLKTQIGVKGKIDLLLNHFDY